MGLTKNAGPKKNKKNRKCRNENEGSIVEVAHCLLQKIYRQLLKKITHYITKLLFLVQGQGLRCYKKKAKA